MYNKYTAEGAVDKNLDARHQPGLAAKKQNRQNVQAEDPTIICDHAAQVTKVVDSISSKLYFFQKAVAVVFYWSTGSDASDTSIL